MQEFSKDEIELIEYLKANFKNRSDIIKKLLNFGNNLYYNRPDILNAAFGKYNKNKWSIEMCKQEALKYKTISEWQKNSNASYSFAYRHKFLKECCAHMLNMNRNPWTLEECKAMSLKYKTHKEWRINSAGSYSAAYKNGWLNKLSKHMIKCRNKWTLYECKQEALKYKTISEWEKNSRGSYLKAFRNKWLDECCEHMVDGNLIKNEKLREISKNRILDFIKKNKKYPGAKDKSLRILYYKYIKQDLSFKKQVDKLLKATSLNT